MFRSETIIREALLDEAALLSELSRESKGYWKYPPSYMEVWQEELTITADYIKSNTVQVIESAEQIVGYYSLVFLSSDLEFLGFTLAKGWWLEHMFVRPVAIGQGYGKAMLDHLLSWLEQNQIKSIKVLADPHAQRFYQKHSWEYIEEVPSSISGRTTPLLILRLG